MEFDKPWIELVDREAAQKNPKDMRELAWLDMRGRLAASLLASVMASDLLRQAMQEDSPQWSPRKIASLACDIAAAAVSEFERRNWLLEVAPLPRPYFDPNVK